MNIGQPADLRQVGLRQRERKAPTVAESRGDETHVGFAKKMRDPADRIQPAQPKQPCAVYRGIDQRREPQLSAQSRTLRDDRIQLAMGHDRDLGGRHRGHVMVQSLQGIGVKVHEVAGNMDCHQLPQTIAIIDVARHDAFGQQHAVPQRRTGSNDYLPCFQCAHLDDPRFQPFAFAGGQIDARFLPEKAVGKQTGIPFISGERQTSLGVNPQAHGRCRSSRRKTY